jgi:hypothetical protein
MVNVLHGAGFSTGPQILGQSAIVPVPTNAQALPGGVIGGPGLYVPAAASTPPSTSPFWQWDWTRDTGFPPELTITRASAATYLDARNIVRIAGNNGPRLDYDGNGNPLGFLIEATQATNVLKNSGDLTATGWQGSNTTVAASSVLAPDGAAFMTQITYTSTAGLDYRGQLYTATITSGEVYTISVWMMAGTASQLYLAINGNTQAANNIVSSLITLTTVPARYTFTATAGANDTGLFFLIGGGLDTSSLLHMPATGTVYAWGGQMEKASVASSYVPTTTIGVTRSADIVSTTDAALLAATGWEVQTGELLSAASDRTILGVNTVIGLGVTSGNAITTTDGGTQTTGNTGTWTGKNRAGLTWA